MIDWLRYYRRLTCGIPLVSQVFLQWYGIVHFGHVSQFYFWFHPKCLISIEIIVLITPFLVNMKLCLHPPYKSNMFNHCYRWFFLDWSMVQLFLPLLSNFMNMDRILFDVFSLSDIWFQRYETSLSHTINSSCYKLY